jgi:hypothetical protein
MNDQGASAVAVGLRSGHLQQGYNSTAIGSEAGLNNQGASSVAIGAGTASTNQGIYATALGETAGSHTQGNYSVSVGSRAGRQSQGDYAIAIGHKAGETYQHTKSIIINATGVMLNSLKPEAFYVDPVRQSTGNSTLTYNTTTKEISYDDTKTFVIDHPLYVDKYLVHGCIEGPESGVMYRGSGTIRERFTSIKLPEYCKIWKNFTVHVTPVNSPNPGMYTTRVNNCMFEVHGNVGDFDWCVYATRNDINSEPLKSETMLHGDGPYSYLTKI